MFKLSSKAMIVAAATYGSRPGWEKIGTGVEHRTPFLPVFPQASGNFHT